MNVETKEAKGPSDSAKRSMSLFMEGLRPGEIAVRRADTQDKVVTVGTVINHLVSCWQSGVGVDAFDWNLQDRFDVPLDMEQRIGKCCEEVLATLQDIRSKEEIWQQIKLTPLVEALMMQGEVRWGKDQLFVGRNLYSPRSSYIERQQS